MLLDCIFQIAIMVGQLAHRRVPGEIRRRNMDGDDDEVRMPNAYRYQSNSSCKRFCGKLFQKHFQDNSLQNLS